MSDSSFRIPKKMLFRLLWDETMKNQSPTGPFTTLDSLATDPMGFTSRLLCRRISRYLPNASLCNLTFYPVIFDAAEDPSGDLYQKALADFVDHCR